MRVRQLVCVVCAALLAMPMLANAEVYKWKDKNGAVRYSDTPPPSNVKLEPMGRKNVTKPTGREALAPVPAAVSTPASPATVKAATGKEGGEDEAAKLRQKNAEVEKRNKEEKEKQAKLKEENCKAAKANHQSYAQGGRVYKMNEKGEREYMSDKDLKEGAEKTQNEIDEYCNWINSVSYTSGGVTLTI